MKNKIKPFLILLLFLIAVFILTRPFFPFKKTKKTVSAKVKRGDLQEKLTISGEIDAEERVILRFQTSGRLSWVGVKEGDWVKKYQLIASLDQRELKKRLKKYLNSYLNERYDFEQTHDDYWQKQYDLSDSVKKEAERIIKKAQNDLNNSVLDVELQNLALEYANLSTPIEGVVVRVGAPFAGVNITPAQAEFEIVNPKTIYFSAAAEQSDVVNLKQGLTGTVTFDSFPEKKYQGKIYFISFSPKKGETGTVYQVKIKLDDKAINPPLRLAMTGDVEFVVKERNNVLFLPISLVKTGGKGRYVYLKKGNKKIKRYIKVGDAIDGKYVIEAGLDEGDVVYD